LDLEIKVADFGLARAMTEGKDYYRMGQRGQLPVRWMALESLIDMVFTKRTDIWSFGVTLWEVMTLAQLPYPGRQNHEVMPLLKKGERLEKPPECPQEIYDLMYKCWIVNPEARPSFSTLVRELEEFLSELMNYFDPMASDKSDKPADPYLTWTLVPEAIQNEQEMEHDDEEDCDLVVDINLTGAEVSTEQSQNVNVKNTLNGGVTIENPVFESDQLEMKMELENDPSE
jgi:serine/threonine protein kinase